MEIIVKCEISEEKIKDIILHNENGLQTEQDVKDTFKKYLEKNIFETLEDNEDEFTNISYEIK